jgi:hypothetical protein
VFEIESEEAWIELPKNYGKEHISSYIWISSQVLEPDERRDVVSDAEREAIEFEG